MKRGQAPAFPFPRDWQGRPGLTKREWIAAQVLAGIYAGLYSGEHTADPGDLINDALTAADKLLEALEK